jgi:sarcosine oxidase subunit beta
MKTFDFLVIGAGSIGVPTAFELARRGATVGIIEQHPSFGRGQNRAAIGGIRATHSDPAKIRIVGRSLEIFRNFESEHGFDVDWTQGGYLYPVYSEDKEATLRNLLAIQKGYGLDIDWISPDEVHNLVPGIRRDNLRGGTFSPGDGSASPLKTSDAYFCLARRAGAQFFFSEPVIGMKVESNRICEVRTARGSYAAGTVILAAGADAHAVGMMAGVDLPVSPDCHEAGVTEPVQPFFKPMVVDIEPDGNSLNYYFYQNKEGQVVFCITPRPSILGSDTDNTSTFLPQVVNRMVYLYPRLRHLRIRRTWRGLYPQTPDGFPIVGRVREVENLTLAVGMCGQGYMLGPGLGEMIADIAINGSNQYDDILEMLTLYRKFSGDEVLR